MSSFHSTNYGYNSACIQLTSIQGHLSPLMLASQQGHADTVALLIESHADLDMQNEVHSVTES